ncbi:MAG: hypothetical protein AB1767_07155 [Bacillota bacterium]
MRFKFIFSVTVVIMALSFVCGATAAWFYTGADGGVTVFTAGTVRISQPVAVQSMPVQNSEQSSCSCRSVTWEFANTGSKRAYIRVRPEATGSVLPMIYIAMKTTVGCESAWAEGERIPGYSGPSWHGRYFAYPLGLYTETAPLVKGLDSNGKIVGTVEIWDDDTKLYFNFKTPGGLKDYYIYAGLTVPPGDAKFSSYPFKGEALPSYSTYLLKTSYIYDCMGGNKVYISTISASSVPVKITLSPASEPFWRKGNDGWWYYGNSTGPTIVNPENGVNISFDFCFDGSGTDLSVSLLAEAIQVTNGAINYTWPSHYWYPLLN